MVTFFCSLGWDGMQMCVDVLNVCEICVHGFWVSNTTMHSRLFLLKCILVLVCGTSNSIKLSRWNRILALFRGLGIHGGLGSSALCVVGQPVCQDTIRRYRPALHQPSSMQYHLTLIRSGCVPFGVQLTISRFDVTTATRAVRREVCNGKICPRPASCFRHRRWFSQGPPSYLRPLAK